MFGRGKKTPAARRAISSTAPFALPQGAQVGGQNGWAPFPALHASQQIGAFAGQMLNQYPANIPGPQLHSGVEWLRSNYYYPALTVLPNGSLQQTQSPSNIAGGQRYGSTYTGPIGPISAKKNQTAVVAAQVRQSGLQAMNWAQGLSQ